MKNYVQSFFSLIAIAEVSHKPLELQPKSHRPRRPLPCGILSERVLIDLD